MTFPQAFFITGTDTNVGKTLVSSALLHLLADHRVVGMKPVAAGCDAQGDNEDVLLLQRYSTVRVDDSLMNPYCFEQPISPHLAAAKQGIQIDLPTICSAFHRLRNQADIVIVEGAGGFCVPLNAQQTGADLAKQLKIPVILVVGMRLGCLNHALLTQAAIQASGLSLAGWVANIIEPNMLCLEENIQSLQQWFAAPLLGIIPHLEQPDVANAARYLNISEIVV